MATLHRRGKERLCGGPFFLAPKQATTAPFYPAAKELIKSMQQTETLKLNLIETGDPISPAPLNDNAEKLETALAALDGTAANLQGRVTVLEAKKMVVGSYIGNAETRYSAIIQTIELGFAPIAVLVSGTESTMALRDFNGVCVELTQTGFQVHNNSGLGAHMNVEERPYRYLAFG